MKTLSAWLFSQPHGLATLCVAVHIAIAITIAFSPETAIFSREFRVVLICVLGTGSIMTLFAVGNKVREVRSSKREGETGEAVPLSLCVRELAVSGAFTAGSLVFTVLLLTAGRCLGHGPVF